MGPLVRCSSSRAHNGHHEPTIDGTPRSAMTYYRCMLCGYGWERGPGLFYKLPSKGLSMEAYPKELHVHWLRDLAVRDLKIYSGAAEDTKLGSTRYVLGTQYDLLRDVVHDAVHNEPDALRCAVGDEVFEKLKELAW